MRTIFSKLPVFEAAGRLESFAKAADELHRSPAAVSRQVKMLEEHICAPLFVREHRRVQLTSEGTELMKTVQLVMRLMEDTLTSIGPKASNNAVRISTDLAFAHFWLLPRLGFINEAHAGTSVSVMASDVEEECLASRTDLPILYGSGIWPGYSAYPIMDEVIFPVCSAAYLETLGNPQEPEDLLRGTLLDVEGGPSTWVAWKEWLSHFSVDADQAQNRIAFSSLPWSVQLAQDNKGIALGWKYLVDPLIETGQLVRPIPQELVTGRGYYILEHTKQSRSETSAKIIQTLIDSARKPSNAPPTTEPGLNT